jgi:hypothetical protein
MPTQGLDFRSIPSYSQIETNQAPVSLLAGGRFSLPTKIGARKMTDAEILTLVDRLERCLLAKEEFHHRDHLTVAVVYLYAADLETAMDRTRSSLKSFATHHSVPKLYHETLTRFWLLQVDQRLDRSECLEQSVRKVREQLSDKNLAFEYYSRERIDSKEAREIWLKPDLKEL